MIQINTQYDQQLMSSKIFYHAMQYSAQRGIVIACRLSLSPFVCDVRGSGPHRLAISQTNCMDI